MSDVYEGLAKPFSDDVIRSVNKGGAKLDYIPVSEVKARLNSVLGVENWGESDTEAWITPDGQAVLAKTCLWIRVEGPDGPRVSSKVGYGGQAVKFRKGTETPVDLGDEFKGAHSDALKKAAQSHGVGLHLARTEEAMEEETREERASEPPASEDVKKAILDKIETLDDDQKKRLGSKFKDERVPRVQTDDFTAAHAELVAGWLKIELP